MSDGEQSHGVQSRRRFLKGSAAVGGLTGIAGCNTSDGGGDKMETPRPFPTATAVDVTPSLDTLVVSIRFAEPVESALDSRGWDGSEVVSFTPDAASKTIQHVDNQSHTGGGYELQLHADGVVSYGTVDGQDIVSSVEMKLDTAIPLPEGETADTVFTYSTEVVTKATHDVEFPDDVHKDTFEFPFPKTVSDLNETTVKQASLPKGLWETGYDSRNFPDHVFGVYRSNRGIPEIDYANNSNLLSMRKLAESKRELWDYIFELFGYHERADERTWASTRALVGEAMYAAAGTTSVTNKEDAAGTVLETYAQAAKQGIGQLAKVPLTMVNLLLAKDAIDEAGDRWANDLMSVAQGGKFRDFIKQARPAYEETRNLQTVEEQTILPAVLLSEPGDDITRRAALRFYDKHLDAERKKLYDLLQITRNSASGVGQYKSSLQTDINEIFTRKTLYKDVSESGPEFVDATENNAKFSGSVATDVSVAALSGSKFDGHPENVLVEAERVLPRRIGYDQELPGLNTATVVGGFYKALKVRNQGWEVSDDQLLREAKAFTHMLDTIDLLLRITRAQQTLLQARTSIYTDTPQRTTTPTVSDDPGPIQYKHRGDWTAISPIQTADSHQGFYGANGSTATNAEHEYTEPGAATILVHEVTNTEAIDDDGYRYALVVTFSAAEGGSVETRFEQPVDDRLLLKDGPTSGAEHDTYEPTRFVQSFASGWADGFIIGLAPDDPLSFRFATNHGISKVVIYSGADESIETTPDHWMQFRVSQTEDN